MEVEFHLTKKRTIHTKWVTQFYNYMSTEDGSEIVIRSGIFEAVTHGSSSLPSIDPFQGVPPLSSKNDGGNEMFFPIEEKEYFVNLCLATDNDSDWGNQEGDEFDRNAFEFIANEG